MSDKKEQNSVVPVKVGWVEKHLVKRSHNELSRALRDLEEVHVLLLALGGLTEEKEAISLAMEQIERSLVPLMDALNILEKNVLAPCLKEMDSNGE